MDRRSAPELGCHYVEFLSAGSNAPASRRSKKKISKFAKLSGVTIALLIVGTFLFFCTSSPHDSLNLKSWTTHVKGSARMNYPKTVPGGFSRFVQSFESFIDKYSKVYGSLEEKARRFEIFVANTLFIELHNGQNFTYTLASNAFTDLKPEEFHALHFTGYRPKHTLRNSDNTDWSLLDVDDDALPNEIDWKQKGCVTAPKDQQKCGACWAFSASGAVEGNYCAKYGKLVSLSEQQMVDCGGPEGNEGCNGGEMDEAFQYIIDRGGLCTEDDYPYTAHDDGCRDKECTPTAKVLKFSDVPSKSEKALKAALALKGPVSIAIQADQLPFQFYHSGVFDASCGKNLNHGVLAIGYGTDQSSDKDFWLVKNSWGEKWGDQGYIKLARDGSKTGKCGMLLEPSFPVMI